MVFNVLENLFKARNWAEQIALESQGDVNNPQQDLMSVTIDNINPALAALGGRQTAVGGAGGGSGCAACRELHNDIRLYVMELNQKLDSFLFRLETLILTQNQNGPPNQVKAFPTLNPAGSNPLLVPSSRNGMTDVERTARQQQQHLASSPYVAGILNAAAAAASSPTAGVGASVIADPSRMNQSNADVLNRLKSIIKMLISH